MMGLTLRGGSSTMNGQQQKEELNTIPTKRRRRDHVILTAKGWKQRDEGDDLYDFYYDNNDVNNVDKKKDPDVVDSTVPDDEDSYKNNYDVEPVEDSPARSSPDDPAILDTDPPIVSTNDIDGGGIVSTCKEPLPDAISQVALQQIAVEYHMTLVNPEATYEDALAQLNPIEERLHEALLKDMMDCHYTLDKTNTDAPIPQEAQFHALYSKPKDIIKTKPDTGEVDTSCGENCYVASTRFSLEVFYHEQRQRALKQQPASRMEMSSTLTDSALVTRLGTYLMDLFNGEELLDDQVASLKFEGFENVVLDGSDTTGTLDTLDTTSGNNGSRGGGGTVSAISGGSEAYQEPKGNEPQVVLSSLAVMAAAVALILVAFLAIRRRRQANNHRETVKSYYGQRLALERELQAAEQERQCQAQAEPDDEALEQDCQDISELLADHTTIVVMSDGESQDDVDMGNFVHDDHDDDEIQDAGYEIDPNWNPDGAEEPQFRPTASMTPWMPQRSSN